MIAFLSGVLFSKNENEIIINVDGVGYFVYVSKLIDLPDPGERINIYIYTYIREDTLDLYGFNSMEERKLFDILLSVSRVGPKAALNILSTLTYEEVIGAIMGEKFEVLKQVSGIGQKTAQRLVLELKSKIKDLGYEYQINTTTGSDNNELYQGLNNLGYTNREIEKALSEINFEKETDLEQKIKMILNYFGGESL